MSINPILYGAGNLATNQLSATTSVTKLIDARATRRGVIFQNLTGSDSVYLGTGSVTTANGYPLPASLNASIYIPTTAAVFGIVTTTTQTVAVMEIFD